MVKMDCKDVGFGTYKCYVYLKPFWKSAHEMIGIDKCLVDEIRYLWSLGIITAGCCCGHGRIEPTICVEEEYIDKMKELGYKVYPNPCRPYDEDCFFAKTKVPLRKGEENGKP